ncbi:MAG: hypothetical protein Q9160_008057 [Pyrenula sp. 1 TL-2023]
MAEAPPPPVEAIGKPEDIISSSSQAKPPPPSSTAKGLDSFLATVNYTLYLLSHISTNPPSLRSITQLLLGITTILRSKLLRQTTLSIPPPSQPAAPSALSLHLTSFCNLVTETRTTLRLLNLIPISLGLRRLLAKPFNPKTDDALLHYLNITQLLAYTTFQAGENIAYLTDKSILPRSRLLHTNGPAGTGKIWLLACRAWTVAVGLDFVKLAREASLERQRRLEIKAGYSSVKKLSTEEEVEMERRWWNALFKAGCWFPVCVHYSTIGGIRGINKGVIGVLGGLAGWEAAAEAWEGTAV